MEMKGRAKRALAWLISVAMCLQMICQYPIFVHASEMQQDDKVTQQTKEEEQATEQPEETEDKVEATEQPEEREEVIEDLLITQNTVLTEDRHVKNLKITSGELHLNGYHLLVEENMLQPGGSVYIDGGELEVKGDYKIIGYTEQGAECSSSGNLYMRNEEDSVKVDGSFVMGSRNDHGSCLTNGTLHIKRNLEQKNFANARSFATSEQFTVCLCGEDEQTLQFTNPDTKYSHIANLEIENTSGKVKANNAVVTRKIKDNGNSYTGFLVLGPECEADENCIHGSVLIKENKVIRQALEVTGTFEVRGGTTTLQNNLFVGRDVTVEYATLNLNGYTMRVNRHTWLRSVGWLIFNNGKYYSMGDFNGDYTNIYISSKMTMNKSGDYLYVGGTYRANNPYRYDISNGIIEIKGNFYQQWTYYRDNFTPTGNNKVILSGEQKQKIQVCTYAGIYCRFNQLILTKPLDQYEFCDNANGGKINCTTVCSNPVYDYSDYQAPSKVENLIYSNYSATKVLLTWDESTDNVAVAKYQVWRDGVQVATVTSPQYIDNSIKPGVRSFYRIYAVDEAGNVSTPSDSLTVLTNDEQPPSIPSGVKIKTMTGTSITIQWNPSWDNGTVERYRIFRDGEYVGSTYSGTTYKDCGLKEDKYYTYTVSAIDSVGNESELSTSVKGIVRMPEIYRLSPAHNTQIGGKNVTLSVDYANYGASIGNQVQYEYKTQDGWKKVNNERLGQHVVSSSTLNSSYVWNLEGIPNGKCDIRCTLYDEDENTYVEEVTYFVDTIGPETPTEVKANTLNSTVTVSWDPSDSVDCIKYHIYRSNAIDGDYMRVATVEGYSTVKWHDTAVEEGERYYYKVSGEDAFAQEGPKSQPVSVEVDKDLEPPVVESICSDKQRLNQTACIHVMTTDNRNVAWVSLEYKDASDQWNTIGETENIQNGKADFYWDTTQLADGTYKLRARAKDGNGNISGIWNLPDGQYDFGPKEADFTIDNKGIAKIQIKETQGHANYVTIKWESVPEDDFSYFSVEQLIDGEFKEIEKVSSTLGVHVQNLSVSTQYQFRVVGYDDIGNRGIESDVVTVSTTKDDVAPVVSQFGPAGKYFNAQIPISIQAKDNVGIKVARLEYRLNAEDWNLLDEIELETIQKEYTYSYTFDVSTFEEGKVSVRAYFYDEEGNVSQSNGVPIENYFYIDHTAPLQVNHVSAEGLGGYISLTWDKPEETDIAGFHIYRADKGKDNYQIIARNVTSYKYYDSAVYYGKGYSYKIVAVDFTGNESELSEEAVAVAEHDRENPVIHGVTPADGTALSGKVELTAAVTDNARVETVMFEYRNKGEQEEVWTDLGCVTVGERTGYPSVIWDVSQLDNCDYEVRILALDAEGNASNSYLVSYTVDTIPPEVPELKAKGIGYGVELTWDACNESDFYYFELSGKRLTDETYTVLATTTSLSYVHKNLKPDKTYEYILAVYDKAGNRAQGEKVAAVPTDQDTEEPVAFCSENMSVRAGSELLLDATGSFDNVRVTEYIWDYGDGTSGEGAIAKHKYKDMGTYKGKLTVKDKAGNVGTQEFTVYVRSRISAKISIRVNNISGNYRYSLPFAYLYVEKDGKGTVYNADSFGELDLILDAGDYIIKAYSEGYMPTSKKLSVKTGEEMKMDISLEKGELVTGSIKTKRLTLEQLQDLGVDLQDENNWYTYTYTFDYKEPNAVTQYTATLTPGKTVEFTETVNQSSGGSSSTSTPTGGSPTFYGRMDTFHGKKVVTIYRTYSYLKKMYEVDLEVTNHAEAGNGFDIVGSTATLNLPEGLSFLKTTARQKPTIELGTLEAQKSKTAVWYIRADKPGSYSLSAQFNGTLMPFEAPVSTLIKAEKPLLVTEEEDNTFTDEGFVTENSRKYSIKVTNKYGEPQKGAILTLSDGDKKCMTITNSYGNAVLEVNVHDMREFHLLVECEGFLSYDETYELDIDTYYDTIILYREGESQEPPDEKKWDENPYLNDSYDIKLIKATLDAKDIIQYEGTINCILNCSSSFGFQFDKKITGYKLSQGNKVLAESDSVNADEIRVNIPAKEFKPDEEVILQVNGAKEKSAVYSLHVVCVKQIYKRVELEYGNSTFNLLTEAAGINTHDNNGYKDVKITCWVENSVENVARYELIQGSDVVASSENGEFELFPRLFEPYIWVYLAAYDNDNNRIDCQRIYLNVSGKLDIGDLFLQMVGVDTVFGEDAELLNGVSFSLPKGKFLLGTEISYSDDGVEISFKPTEEDLEEGEGNADTKANKFINKKIPKWLKITPSGTIKGAYESGKDSAQIKLTGDVKFAIAVSFEKEIQAIPTPPIVVKMGIETTATIGGQGEIALPIKGEEKTEFDLAIIYAFEIALSLSAGIGIAEIASVGVYGGASFGIEGKIAPEHAVDTIKLGGNAGVEASLFGFSKKFELLTGEWTLYDREKEEQLEEKEKANSLSLQIGEYESGLYDAEDYAKNPLEEELSSEWSGNMQNAEKDCISMLKTNTGTSLQIKLITCKDTIMLVFTDKKTGSSWSQSSALFYSLYDKEGKTWSQPKEVIPNDNPDFNPDVTTDGERIYVAWNEANAQAENADDLVEASKCMEVRVASYDADSDEFTAYAPLTDNEKCENHIQIASLDGKPVVTWVENDQDNPFGAEGTNQIIKAELSDGAWNIETLASVEGMITSMDAGRLNERLYVAYAQDSNSVMVDTDDQMLTLIDLSTNEKRTLAEKNVRNVSFTMFDKESVLSWCQDGKVHAISSQDDDSSVIYDKVNIGAGVYNIIGDDKGNCGIYYVSTKDYSSQIYFAQYDKESRQWGAPVNVTSQQQYLRNASAVYVDETPLMSFGCEEAEWNQEEKQFDVKETGNLCCMNMSSTAKPVIEDVTYQSEEAIPGGNVDLNVVLKNVGIAPTKEVTVFVIDETGNKVSEQEYQADILTGDRKNFNITVSLPYSLQEHNYQVFAVTDGNESEAYEFTLGYADLEISRRILIQNGQYLIAATVTNQGICPAAGIVKFYNFDNPAEVLHSEEIGLLNYGEQETVTWKVDDAYVKDVAQYNVGIQVKTDSKQMNTKNDMKIASLYGSPKQTTYGITFDYHMDTYKNAFAITDMYGRVMFPADPVRPGYQFMGWYCNNARFTTMSIFEEDMTLVPRWSSNVQSEPEPTPTPTPSKGDNGGTQVKPVPSKGGSHGDNEGTQVEPQVKKGDYVKYKGFVYKVTSILKSSRTVTLEKPVKPSSIKEATIPSVIKIYGNTFKVNKIDKNAFKKCKKLKKVTIGANVTHIGSRAFYGCKNLTSIKLKTYKLKAVGKDAWKGTEKNIIVQIPKKKNKAYKKLLTGKGLNKTVKYKNY